MAFLKNVSDAPVLKAGANGLMMEFPQNVWVEIDDAVLARDLQIRTQLPPSTKHGLMGKFRLEMTLVAPPDAVHASHKFLEEETLSDEDPPHRKPYEPHGSASAPARASGVGPTMPYKEVMQVEQELIWRHSRANPDPSIKLGKSLGVIKKAGELEQARLAQELWNAGVRYQNEKLVHIEKLDRRPKPEPVEAKPKAEKKHGKDSKE